MKQLIKKLFGWLKDSNRPNHIKCGFLVFIAMLATCLVLGVNLASSLVIAFVATCIVATAVDYKDQLWGGKFDWLDVIATVLIPGIITVVGVPLLVFI